MNILLLSPYDCMSHRYWREHLARVLEDRLAATVTSVIRPARFFSWRQRGNSLSFAADEMLQTGYDLVIATSMTDLSALRGLNRRIATTPAILYFHENQFAYPDRVREGLIERQMTSIYSALSADSVIFNSDWNARSFREGASTLLKKMPDDVPPGVVESIESKSEIIPVALGDSFPSKCHAATGLDIVWNHRWEYDKGPALLLGIVQQLIDRGVEFRMSLLGQRYESVPDELRQVERLLKESDRLGHNAFVEKRSEYLECLSKHHVVLSTAEHEFQGLAVQEAMLCGCTPLVPDRLVYPEYVPEANPFKSERDAVDRLDSGLPAVDNSTISGHEAIAEAWCNNVTSLMS